jgi:hypothetical protein
LALTREAAHLDIGAANAAEWLAVIHIYDAAGAHHLQVRAARHHFSAAQGAFKKKIQKIPRNHIRN